MEHLSASSENTCAAFHAASHVTFVFRLRRCFFAGGSQPDSAGTPAASGGSVEDAERTPSRRLVRSSCFFTGSWSPRTLTNRNKEFCRLQSRRRRFGLCCVTARSQTMSTRDVPACSSTLGLRLRLFFPLLLYLSLCAILAFHFFSNSFGPHLASTSFFLRQRPMEPRKPPQWSVTMFCTWRTEPALSANRPPTVAP